MPISRNSPDTGVKPYILLVDDHPHNLITLEAVLGTSEYHILTASSGQEALGLLNSHDVALVLLDIQMPGMDGYEVARRIKACSETKHIPIILVTAIFREDEHVRRGYEAGAIDYFAKPFNPELLRTKVGIYAELYRKNIILRRHEEERRDIESKYAALNRTYEEYKLTLQKEAERRVAELNTVLESIPDAIYVGDQNGITRCNSAALSMFGLGDCATESFQKLAERIQMRYPESGQPIPVGELPFSRALRGESHVAQVRVLHVCTGEDRLVACAATPVILDEQIIGAVVVNLDISKEVGVNPPKDLGEFPRL